MAGFVSVKRALPASLPKYSIVLADSSIRGHSRFFWPIRPGLAGLAD